MRSPAARSRSNTPKQILLVEDDRDSGRALALELQLRGYEVKWATSGPQAMRQMPAGRFQAPNPGAPDLVLLDLQLPDANGAVLARRLREKGRVDPPIIALAGGPSAAAAEAGRRVGAAAVVAKPVAMDDLLRKIEGVFSSRRRTAVS
jgi:DNA-binding response OmpR family regulator